MKVELRGIFKNLYEEIAHGDDEHRKWLYDKMCEFQKRIWG